MSDPTGFVIPQGGTGVGVPEGGTTGQALVKASPTNFDTEWADVVGGGGTLPGVEIDCGTFTSDTANIDCGAFV